MPNTPPLVTRCTPVRIVDAVEPSLEFWTTRFGFKNTGDVPGDDGKLVFAMMDNGAAELMYQTRASVIAEEPEATREARVRELEGDSTVLFLQVSDMDAVERAIEGVEVIKPRHDTFYGMTEIYIREPGGGIVGFAMPTPGAAS